MINPETTHRLTKVEFEEVFPKIVSLKENGRKKEKIRGELVNVYSVRLNTFKHKGIKCAGCDLEAKYFALEKHADQEAYHLNLYAIKDDKEVLFTYDHIKARCLGGKDHLSNTQTMCGPCNWLKGQEEEKTIILKRIKEKEERALYKKKVHEENIKNRIRNELRKKRIDIKGLVENDVRERTLE